MCDPGRLTLACGELVARAGRGPGDPSGMPAARKCHVMATRRSLQGPPSLTFTRRQRANVTTNEQTSVTRTNKCFPEQIGVCSLGHLGPTNRWPFVQKMLRADDERTTNNNVSSSFQAFFGIFRHFCQFFELFKNPRLPLRHTVQTKTRTS